MIPAEGVAGQRCAVLGLGRTGQSAVESLKAGGADVIGWDEAADAREQALAAGIKLRDLSAANAWDDIECLIVSPGIPHLYPKPNKLVSAAQTAGIPIDNDIGMFFRLIGRNGDSDGARNGPTVIAVTGSNGKSTTSALIDHALRHAGRNSQLAGNIGRGVLDLDPPREGDFVVLEISSYQSDMASVLAPEIAVFLNLTPDHLERHGGKGGYFAAKRRLLAAESMKSAIIGVDEDEGRFLASQACARTGTAKVVRVSGERILHGRSARVYSVEGTVCYVSGDCEYRIDASEIRSLAGTHNQQNACAALAACLECGLDVSDVEAGFASFSGLPHRSQIVGEFGGVLCVNDSKATNAESAEMALKAYKRIRWIAGGLGKENGILPLVDSLDNVVKAYLIGHSAKEFALQVGGLPNVICKTLPEAVANAASDARPGDTILLAPAAASFDQYPDFEARGRHFIDEIHSRFGKP